MKYKILVLDVDGTLVDSNREISKRTLTALRKVQQTGIRIVLASGRPVSGIMPIARQIELHNYGGYVLAYNGAQVVDAASGETIFEKRVDPQLIPYVEKKARKNGFGLFSYHRDFIITNSPDNAHVKHEAEINDMRIVAEEEFSIAIDFAPCKVVLVSDDYEALTGLETHWQKRLDGTLDTFMSENFFLEVVAPGIDKSNTLAWLLDHIGVPTDEVMAIGDGVRDVKMLQMAGYGVAMGNAVNSVLACADAVTGTNDTEGVAEAVEKHILSHIIPMQIPLEQLNALAHTALMGNLGIRYTFASTERIEATMPVDKRTRQPFGILHGGATLALAETVAGLGSMLQCSPEEFAVGMQVSGNHISSAHEGDTVRAVGTIVHKGRSSHVWNVDVFTSTGKLVSSVRVINSVMKRS